MLNACLVRSSTSEAEELDVAIYDLEKKWYGSHPLQDIHAFRLLRDQHKEELQKIRESTGKLFRTADTLIQNINIGDIYAEQNQLIADEFSKKVKDHSEYCSKAMLNFAKIICCSSETLVGKPTCAYALAALGSIARNEATPYSDLEYAFLVQSGANKEYFVRLAVDTYFRITNLGETPLKYFYIDELHSEGKRWFDDKSRSGFKIDGLLPKAGNIPTGNGLPTGQSLIVTVDELMAIYSSSAMASDAEDSDAVGDLSDLLCSVVQAHSYDDETAGTYGHELIDEFIARRCYFDQELSPNNQLRLQQKKLKTLYQDIEGYDYCPDDVHTVMTNRQVKTDIFRYPTIVAYDLKIALKLQSETAWDVFHDLCYENRLISQEVLAAFQFILMSAVWMRTSAYLYGDTQREYLSFHPQYDEQQVDNRFFVPKKLYIAMAIYLAPFKRSLLNHIRRNAGNVSVDSVKEALRSIRVDREDSLLQSRLYYLCGDYKEGLEQLNKKLGIDVTDSVSRLVELGTAKIDTEKAVELTAYLLFHHGDFAKAIPYFQWLYERYTPNSDPVKCASITALKAQCLMMLGQYESAKKSFDDAGRFLLTLIGAKGRKDIVARIFQILSIQDANPVLAKIKLLASVNSRFLANSVRYHQGRYKKTEENFRNLLTVYNILTNEFLEPVKDGLVIANFNTGIGLYYLQLGHYSEARRYLESSEKNYTEVFGTSAATIDHSSIQLHLGILSMKVGEYEKSYRLCSQALDMLTKTEQTVPPNFIACHQALAEVHFQCGRYEQALIHVQECKDITKRSSGRGYTLNDGLVEIISSQILHAQVANDVCVNSSTKRDMLNTVKEQTVLAISVLKHTLFRKVTQSHPDIATALRVLGQVTLELGEIDQSKDATTKSLAGFREAYGPDDAHPDTNLTKVLLGKVFLESGELNKASEYVTSALEAFLRTFGAESSHQNILNAREVLANIESAREVLLNL